MSDRDRWAEWLRNRRDGADPRLREANLGRLGEWRDLVLEGARLRSGDHLLDVGTGEGLIGFGALERLGPNGLGPGDTAG